MTGGRAGAVHGRARVPVSSGFKRQALHSNPKRCPAARGGAPHVTAGAGDRACRTVPPRLPEAKTCETTLGSGCPPPAGPNSESVPLGEAGAAASMLLGCAGTSCARTTTSAERKCGRWQAVRAPSATGHRSHSGTLANCYAGHEPRSGVSVITRPRRRTRGGGGARSGKFESGHQCAGGGGCAGRGGCAV